MTASRLSIAVIVLAAALAPPAMAEEQLVYWPLVTNATEYRRVPYPREAGPIQVLAGSEVVIEARYAEVSFWPITREYLADLSGKPRFSKGTVEIVDGSGTVTTVEPETYVLWYPAGVGAGPSALVRGEEARALHANYVETARNAAERLLEYQRIVAESNAAVEAWARMAAQDPKSPPPPPPELTVEEPEPFQAFATEPREAAVTRLDEGSYRLRVRGPDGNVIAGSERELVSFAPLARGTGHVIRPENRWTRPIATFAPGDTIYTTGGTDLFLQPVPVVEYPARGFTRLFDPQSVEVIDPSLTLWVPNEEGDDPEAVPTLSLWRGDERLETLALTAYRVVQRPGVSRGYVIEEFTRDQGSPLEPDFRAMRVPGDLALSHVTLADDSGRREIRRVRPAAEPFLFLPALLPLAVGLGVRTWTGMRRRRGATEAKPT